MKDKLTQYVNLLFAGAPGAEDIQQEILQNTLDRYDNLISQGKTPEAAYSLAIAGIGDVTEILGSSEPAAPVFQSENRPKPEYRNVPVWKKVLRAVAVCLYIISVIPLIVLAEFGMEILGLCGMLAIVGVATALIIVAGGNRESEHTPARKEPQYPAYKIFDVISTVVMFVVYFSVSFKSGAWHITWLIFPIFACIDGVVKAIFDLMEAGKYEN